MGYGDQIMAVGLAEALYRSDPSAGPVMICDCAGAPRDQPLWHGNPAIGVRVGGPTRTIRCGGGCLPYLQYPYSSETGLRFSSTYRAADYRGHIYLTQAELERGHVARAQHGDFVLLEPTPSDRKNPNRCWPRASWQALAVQLKEAGLPVVQFHHADSDRLVGVPCVDSPTFRDACGIMTGARLLVVLEGGLAFAAAALSVPTVVLWGGCISAPVLSYPEQVNLVDPSPETPCGSFKTCHHCAAAWARLTPERVSEAIQHTLQGVPHGVS